ncbi:MAG: peptidoglycan synthetase [Saprospiraceae bacterium]|nr:peptidoglycan synthetase [Saprospiraceae bacterium]
MKKIHFIAIGGKAMHNLALALCQKGYQITGSDDEIYDPSLTRLKDAGLLPEEMGWDPARITEDIDVIILGMHARSDNPELARALELGLKVYSYPEFLYEMSKEKTRVVVAGSHGKTTTTALIMRSLEESGLNHDYMVGAQIDGYERMVSISDSDIIVLEGDEYLSSPIDRRPKFLHYHPHVVIITGIAWDHINVFPTFDSYVKQFSLLIASVEQGGTVIYFKEDHHIQELIASIDRDDLELIPYASAKLNDGNEVFLNHQWMKLPIIGKHNYQNLEACRLCVRKLGVDEATFAKAMLSFKGVSRRLQVVPVESGNLVFIDYAHAPSKVKATTAAVREWYPDQSLVACFELHTFSSLNESFLPEYRDAMSDADNAIIYYDHHTIEMKRMKPLNSDRIRKAFNRSDALVITEKEELEDEVSALQKKEVIFLFMSSGTFSGLEFDKIFK